MPAEDATAVDPTDADTIRTHLAQFAGDSAVSVRGDGAVVADFRGVTHVTVRPDNRIETGMPLNEFAGRADRLLFDHESGELRVERDSDGESAEDTTATFRRP